MISRQSAKAKGRKHQQAVCAAILEAFPHLTPDDVVSCPMGSHGDDCRLSQAAREAFPYGVECKARATGFTALYDALRQATRDDGLTPIAVVKQDRCKPLVVIDLEAFMKIVSL